MAIRTGERSFDETIAEIEDVEARLKDAFERTDLPATPDEVAVDGFSRPCVQTRLGLPAPATSRSSNRSLIDRQHGGHLVCPPPADVAQPGRRAGLRNRLLGVRIPPSALAITRSRREEFPMTQKTTEFRVLGQMEVLVDDRQMRLGGRRLRSLLAALLVRPRQVLTPDQLIENIWGYEGTWNRQAVAAQPHLLPEGHPRIGGARDDECGLRARRRLHAGRRRQVRDAPVGGDAEQDPGSRPRAVRCARALARFAVRRRPLRVVRAAGDREA
jgi:hypothetical protein